jgi:cation transport ATPase
VGEYPAAAVIAVMVTSGRALEGWAAGRAHRDLHVLLQRAPRTAHRYEGEMLRAVAVEILNLGDRVLVGRGQVVPTDGALVNAAVLDESALTGGSQAVSSLTLQLRPGLDLPAINLPACLRPP